MHLSVEFLSFGASQCSTGALGQIWPIPYLSALKTIAFDYPVTNAIRPTPLAMMRAIWLERCVYLQHAPVF